MRKEFHLRKRHWHNVPITYVFFPLIVLLMSGCVINRQQLLPFDVIGERAFPTEGKILDEMQQLIVISDSEQITQLEFGELVEVYLDDVDFNQYFIILVTRGQLKDSGIVKEVVRVGNEVFVKTREIDPGPGNYVLAGFTPPYQILRVTKLGDWNKNFDFLLDREGSGVVSEETVYIP